MQLLVPMAGLGKRFSDVGYHLPKALIPVGGVPMIGRAVADTPPHDRKVFVCHPDHVRDFSIDQVLARRFPGCRIVVTPGSTEGQACTVALAADELDLKTSVLVGACDATHVYDQERFEFLARDGGFDAIVWGFRSDPRVLLNPRAYGWLRLDSEGRVAEVSVKQPVSDRPIADFAITGTFWFRTAGIMLESIQSLRDKNIRVNSEFYLDSVVGLLAQTGYRVGVFEVDKFICWGTPEDLAEYQLLERHFRLPPLA